MFGIGAAEASTRFGLEPHGREIRLALSTPLLQKPGEMPQAQIQSHRRGRFVAPPSCLSWSCSFKKRRGFTIIIITINSCRFLERRQSSNSEVFSDPSASPVTLSHSPKCLDCLLSACYWCPSQDMGHSLSPVALFKLGDSQLTEDRNGV